MKLNNGFLSWNKPYLFQDLDDTYRNLPDDVRGDVISLAIGDPDIPTPQAIREAIRSEHRTHYHGYPSVMGRLSLREALSDYYWQRFHVPVAPDDIFIGMGAKTDLFDISAVFGNPGDVAAILDPAYPVYCDATVFRGQRIHFLTGTPENNYRPVLNESDIGNESLALIYMCYPNNPTGALATSDYIASMIETAIRRSAMVVHDIAYSDFIPGNTGSGAFSIFSIPGGETAGIEIGSFSKPFSMTGDRISWVIIKNKAARDAWKRFRSNRDSGVSEYIQAGALAALTSDEVIREVRNNMEIYGQRRDVLVSGLKQMNICVTSLQNTPYAWFRSPIADSRKAAKIILEQARIMLTPGIGFGPAGEGYLRATIFQPSDILQEAVRRLSLIPWNSITQTD